MALATRAAIDSSLVSPTDRPASTFALEHDQRALHARAETFQGVLLRIEVHLHDQEVLVGGLRHDAANRVLRLAGRTPGRMHLDQDRPPRLQSRIEAGAGIGGVFLAGGDGRRAGGSGYKSNQLASGQHGGLWVEPDWARDGYTQGSADCYAGIEQSLATCPVFALEQEIGDDPGVTFNGGAEDNAVSRT